MYNQSMKTKLTLSTPKRNIEKLQVSIHNDHKLVFEVDGAFPSYISAINYGKKSNILFKIYFILFKIEQLKIIF